MRVYEEGSVCDSLADDERLANAASTGRRLRQLQPRERFQPEMPHLGRNVRASNISNNAQFERRPSGHGLFDNDGRTPGSAPHCWTCQQVGSRSIAPSSAEAVVANHTGLSNHKPLLELVDGWTEHEFPDWLESDEISACDSNVHVRLLHPVAFLGNIGASDFVL